MSLAVHELRTPASVVAGYLRMLQRDPDLELGNRQRHMLEEAEKSMDHMVTIVNQLSDLAKLEAGSGPAVEGPFDAFQLIADAAVDVRGPEDGGVGLRVDGDAEGAHLVGDHARFRVAMAALLQAVLREQPAGTTVVAHRRRAMVEGRTAALVVISREADLARAAEIGAVTPAFDELRGGLGLSMPIARLVVERLGGRVWSPLVGDADPACRGAIVVAIPTAEPRR